MKYASCPVRGTVLGGEVDVMTRLIQPGGLIGTDGKTVPGYFIPASRTATAHDSQPASGVKKYLQEPVLFRSITSISK